MVGFLTRGIVVEWAEVEGKLVRDFGEQFRLTLGGSPGHDHHRRNALLVAGLAFFLVIVASAGLLPSPTTVNPSPTSTAVSAFVPNPTVDTVVTPIDDPGVSDSQFEPTPAPTPTATPAVFDCDDACLVRLPESDSNIEALREFEIGVALSSGGQLWAAMEADIATTLSGRGLPVALVAKSIDTLPLYVVRLPEGGSADAVRDFGEIVDSVGNQFLVRVPGAPPYIDTLARQGIAVEKFPPIPVEPGRRSKPELGDPWNAAQNVSATEIQTTISELQEIGSDDGFGTRHYATAGNVEAAEYLFNRLAEYGLKVWYEDFIADNGTLALNVVGEIPGRDASSIYLISAHFDTIADDTGDPSLAPGALDNGTGVATLLETARVLSEYDLAHPVHVVFFNAEEVGLQGARAFGQRALAEGRPYAGAYNIDSVGAYYETNRLIVNADDASAWLQDIVVRVNGIYGGLEIDLWPRQNPLIVADDEMLSQAGIPTILVAAAMYGDPLINQSNDTLAQVDVFRVQRVAQLVVLSLGELVG